MISIVILNWNGKDVTADCLQSVKEQTFEEYEVILVDNASTDGSSEFLKKKFPLVKFIQNKENRGYAGGNNIGVKKAKGKYILILNNDTILDKNFLEELWKNRNKADILGVKNYYFDRKHFIWAIGSKVNWLTMRAKLVANKLEDSKEVDKMQIEHAVGSAMLINKKVIDKIGFLDESFFAYYEETEWQTRAQKADFKISWVPSAKLWHRVAYSTGGKWAATASYYQVRNRAYLIKKHSKLKLVAYLYWILEVIVKILYGLIKDWRYAKITLKGAIDFFKDKKGKLD